MNVTPANLWCTQTLGILFAGLLSGCGLPLAYPPMMDSASRGEIEASTRDSIKIGKTTRLDVLLEFGEPDGRAIDDSWFSYGSSRVWGIGILGNGGPMGHQGIDARRITIRFGPEGVVTKVDFQQRSCSRSSGDYWEMHPRSCLDPSGSDLHQTTNYTGYSVVRLIGVNVRWGTLRACALTLSSAGDDDQPLAISDKAIFVGGSVINFRDLAGVLPLREQDVKRWLILRRKDDNCIFISIPSAGDEEIQRVHDLIEQHLQEAAVPPRAVIEKIHDAGHAPRHHCNFAGAVRSVHAADPPASHAGC